MDLIAYLDMTSKCTSENSNYSSFTSQILLLFNLLGQPVRISGPTAWTEERWKLHSFSWAQNQPLVWAQLPMGHNGAPHFRPDPQNCHIDWHWSRPGAYLSLHDWYGRSLRSQGPAMVHRPVGCLFPEEKPAVTQSQCRCKNGCICSFYSVQAEKIHILSDTEYNW